MIQRLKESTLSLLRWSQQYTKTDMSYLARGGFWLSISQVVTALSGLALAVAFANLLPKETYGVYRFILSGAAILAATGFSGLNTALTRAVAQGNYGAYFSVFKERVKWGVLGALGALGGSLYYALNGNDTLSLAFLIIAVFTPYSDALNVYTGYRSGLKDFRYGAISEIIIRVGGAFALLGTLFFTHNVLLLVFVYFSAYTVLRLAFFLHTARSVKHTDTKISKETLVYGRHLSVMYLMSTIAAHADKIVIFHFAGATALAAYAFAIIIPDQIRTSIKNIAVLAFPKFSTSEFRDVLEGLARKNILLGLATAVVIIGYVLIAPHLFKYVFPAYEEAIFLTQLLALTLIDVLTLLPLSALKAHKKTRVLYQYHILVSVVQIILVGVGGALAGLEGTIAGLVLGRAVAVLYALSLVFSFRKNMHTTSHV